MESKKVNFSRISESRTAKIVDMIRLLGNLTNKSFYEYTDDQIDSMFDRIQKELDDQKKLFSDSKRAKQRIQL